MGTFNSKLLKACEKNKSVKVLVSDGDFAEWYLNVFKLDVSMFLESEVQHLLDEEKPKRYPCIPLISEDRFDVTYIGLDHVEHWFKTLFRINY